VPTALLGSVREIDTSWTIPRRPRGLDKYWTINTDGRQAGGLAPIMRVRESWCDVIARYAPGSVERRRERVEHADLERAARGVRRAANAPGTWRDTQVQAMA
jgi:hypothetical protein